MRPLIITSASHFILSGNYDFSDHLSTRLGYTLTNTAPTESELNPYNMSTDSLVKTQGNPYLLPSQNHKLNLSLTFNTKGFYLTPSVSYRISTDLVESYGFSEEDIYISSYRNSGKYKNLRIGGSLSSSDRQFRAYRCQCVSCRGLL